MSLNKLIDYIQSDNIAAKLSNERLRIIAQQVVDRAEIDSESMKDWVDSIKQGIKLCKPEYHGKSTPWPDAANFKSTILTEAANAFGNRASIEIMRDPKLVKASIIGLATIKNVIDKKASDISLRKQEMEKIADGMQQLEEAGEQIDPEMQAVMQQLQEKTANDEQVIKQKKDQLRKRNERAERVTEMMNWQVNVKMPEWRKDQKRLMYSLPNVGSLFKKTYFDPTIGRCVSKTIQFPNFIVNQQTASLKSCRSFTEVVAYTKSEYDIRVQANLWVDAEIYKDAETNDAGGNEDEESKETEDNPNKFYEQYCWIDMDEDGIEEPYIVTLHVSSGKIVRIVARYDEDCIIVKSEGYAALPLIDAQKKAAAQVDADNAEFGTKLPYADADDLSAYDLVRVEAIDILTKYGMIPSFDGSFLDVGYYHLIGSMTMGVNKTTNDLLNAGSLANSQTGIVAKNFRKKPGNFAVKMGEFTQTEVSPAELQTSIFRLPYGEPSQTLFMLNEKLENSARSFSSNVDNASQLQANTAPTTALAIIQQSQIQHTAHMSMIVDSMTDEFNIIFKLNKDYVDDTEYKEVVGDDEAVFADDFNTDGLAIACSANPEMSSRMQRMMLAEAEMAQLPMVVQAGGNPIPIIKNYYSSIGSENLDEIFPNEAEMSPEEKAQMQAMRQQQELSTQMQQEQLQLIKLQTDLLQSGERRKDFEAQVAAKETLAKIDKLFEDMEEVKSQTVLNYEKAESEQVKNNITTYTAISSELSKAEESQREELGGE
jgi:chaperonin GroES